VVVIDLRETYTVGPVIDLLDRAAEPLERSYRNSAIQRLADALGRSGIRVADTRAGRAVGRVLAPPEPPTPAESEREAGQDALVAETSETTGGEVSERTEDEPSEALGGEPSEAPGDEPPEATGDETSEATEEQVSGATEDETGTSRTESN